MAQLERDALIANLKRIIVEECDAEFTADEIADETPLIGEGLELDSLDALQIALAVKDNYGVRIEGGPDSRKALANVGVLADFIIAYRKTAG